jgi:hypothetical protein
LGSSAVLTIDVERFIARKFQASDRVAALALCRSATIHDGSFAGPRLIRCALIASAASLEKLRTEIEHLKIDYRDVILAGEYASKDGELIRVRNLNEPFEDES